MSSLSSTRCCVYKVHLGKNHTKVAAPWIAGVGPDNGAEARADGSGPAAQLSAAQDADSGTSGDGRSEHAAALGRASTAGSNSLEVGPS